MLLSEVYTLLKELQFPLAYHHFEEGSRPRPPYLVYLVTDSDNHGADNWTYHKQNNLQVELYTTKKDLATEQRVESLFSLVANSRERFKFFLAIFSRPLIICACAW